MGKKRTSLRSGEAARIYRNVKGLYLPGAGLFEDEGDRAAVLRKRMAERLTETERTTLILYAELESLAAVAEVLKVSKSRIYREIQEIKRKLL